MANMHNLAEGVMTICRYLKCENAKNEGELNCGWGKHGEHAVGISAALAGEWTDKTVAGLCFFQESVWLEISFLRRRVTLRFLAGNLLPEVSSSYLNLMHYITFHSSGCGRALSETPAYLSPEKALDRSCLTNTTYALCSGQYISDALEFFL